MNVTTQQLVTIAGGKPDASNVNSVALSLNQYGYKFGLDKPHRLAQFLAQLCEESGGFRYDKEIASGAEYEGRKDLGNIHPGDGARFKGRTPGQITGRANYRAFTKWCRDNIAANCPDFEAQPELLNTDPWEGLGPIWFWATRKLNALADENNIEQITKKWNGGLNGFDVRLKFYTRAGLVLLGQSPDDIRAFQLWALDHKYMPAGSIDGDAGPKTRSAIHMALVDLDKSGGAAAVATPSPVVSEVEVEKPVVPKGADHAKWSRAFGGISFAGIFGFLTDIPTEWKIAFGVIAVLGVIALLLRGEQIAARAKSVLASFES